ncbi:hypothetical protein GQ600_13650 [Phytophthora cactorum]|nr:hypothetical protein GQ600_13650 [Phytophthora cactorum]
MSPMPQLRTPSAVMHASHRTNVIRQATR